MESHRLTRPPYNHHKAAVYGPGSAHYYFNILGIRLISRFNLFYKKRGNWTANCDNYNAILYFIFMLAIKRDNKVNLPGLPATDVIPLQISISVSAGYGSGWVQCGDLS